MRQLLLSALLILPAAALAEPPLRAPVEIPVMGFKARLDDGRVIAAWRRYKRDDFKRYVLVKSDKTADASCPKPQQIFSSGSEGDLKYEDGKLAAGTWSYRVCIVTRFGDVWASPAVSVAVEEKDLRRAPPTDADFE